METQKGNGKNQTFSLSLKKLRTVTQNS